MTIEADDDDIPFGDAVNFGDAAKPYVNIPSWMTITDNDDGTATLSGTPSLSDVGTSSLKLEIHDRTTHYKHTHCTWDFFEFDVNVFPCDITLSGSVADTGCPNSADGLVDLTVSSSNTTDYIDWDNDGTGDNDDAEDLSGVLSGTYTVTVMETNGCSATETFTIGSTSDNTLPTITCPSDVLIDTDMGTCEATNVSLGSEVSNDNCMVSSVSNDAPTSFSKGMSVVTWTVTDDSGNTGTCQQNVTVSDNENPTITCPSDIFIDADMGTCEATGVALGTESSTDNCTVLSVLNDAPTSFSKGITAVTWTVTDDSGNTAVCQQNVTVLDNENPTITCPSDIFIDADMGTCEATNVSLGVKFQMIIVWFYLFQMMHQLPFQEERVWLHGQ